MVIKNSELNSESIQELNNLIDMDINAASAFKLMRIIKELSSLVDDKLKLEKKIFDKYVEKDAEGKPVLAKDEAGEEIPNAVRITDMEAFNNEMLELMEVTNEVSYDKIKFEDLKLETAKVKDLLKIDFLFE
jgi:hypothetical protein